MLDTAAGKGQTLPMPITTKRQLLETLYPAAGDSVATMQARGDSWRTIAEAVAEASGVTVSHESLRQWYGSDERATA